MRVSAGGLFQWAGREVLSLEASASPKLDERWQLRSLSVRLALRQGLSPAVCASLARGARGAPLLWSCSKASRQHAVSRGGKE